MSPEQDGAGRRPKLNGRQERMLRNMAGLPEDRAWACEGLAAIACNALEKKGLATKIANTQMGAAYTITDAGREALRRAAETPNG